MVDGAFAEADTAITGTEDPTLILSFYPTWFLSTRFPSHFP